MSLTHFRSCLAATALLLCCVASHADPTTTASPPAPFLITLHVANAPGKDCFDLDNPGSSFDITFKNTSAVPQTVPDDEAMFGMGVAIIAINGNTLSSPCGLAKHGRAWSAFRSRQQTLMPGQETIRHILLSEYEPRFAVIPHQDPHLTDGVILPRLAGSNSSRFETITAIACYTTYRRGEAIDRRTYKLISHEIDSAPVTFKTGL